MNRAERRRLAKDANRLHRSSRGEGVSLHGGPMDTWFVKPDAPTLDPGWGATAGFPGFAYVRRDKPDRHGQEHADWKRLVAR